MDRQIFWRRDRLYTGASMIETLTNWLHFVESIIVNENAVITAVFSWIFTFALLQFIKYAAGPFKWRCSYPFKAFLSFGAIFFTYTFIVIGGGVDLWFWKIGLSICQPLAYKTCRWYANKKGWTFLEAGYVFGSAAPSEAAVASAVEAGKPIRGAVRNFYELSASGNFKRIDTERLRGLSKEQDE